MDMVDTGGYSLNINCYGKGTSIYKYFCGIKFLDSVLSYLHENKEVLTRSDIERDLW